MANEQLLNLQIEIPFPSEREAEIVFHSLRVDGQPLRSQVKKHTTLRGNHLIVKFTAPEARQLRVATSSLMEFLILSTETMNMFGPSRSQEYSHFGEQWNDTN